RNRAAHAHPAGVAFAVGEFVGNTEGRLPGDFSGGCIHRCETAPWWFLTRHELVVESRQESGAARAVLVVGRRCAFGLLLDPSDRAPVVRVDEYISQLRIGGGPAPIDPSQPAGE